MKFFFCETCGKRITEEEAANKQMKGMYCKGCAASVMTMEFTALTSNDVATALKKQPASSSRAPASLSETGRHRRPTAEAAAARSSRGQERLKDAEAAAAPAPTNMRLYAGIAAGVGVAIGLLLLMMLRGGSGRAPAVPEAKATLPPAASAQKPDAGASPVTPPPKTTAAPAAPVTPNPVAKVERPLSADERADKAFDELKKALSGVAADNITEKEKLANEFLKEHGETIIASRVRTMAASWRAPPSAASTAANSGGSVTLVDFGATAAATTFGLAGWNTVIMDRYTECRPLGPGGSTIVTGDNDAYNYQGVSGAARAFAAGEKIIVTWHNAGTAVAAFTPMISFNDPDRRGSGTAGTWHSMSDVSLPANGSGTSQFTVGPAQAGSYTLVNVNSNFTNKQTLVCDKIDLVENQPAAAVAANPVVPGEVIKELFNGKDTEGWIPHGTTKGRYRVEDGLLVFDESISGLLHTKAPSRDYTVEVEVFLEDNTGSYMEIVTRAGKIGINRSSTNTWLKVLVTVKDSNLQARQIQTPTKGSLEIMPNEGNDLFGIYTSGKGKKKIRAIRVMAEKN